MNRQSNSALSIYQLIRELEPSFQPLVVSIATLKSLVGAFIDHSIEQKPFGQIWVKFTETDGWVEEIERYQQHGCAEKIYLCATLEQQSVPLFNHFSSEVISVELESSPHLERESFLIALAPRFCGSIVARQQNIDPMEPPTFEIACIFAPESIAKVLARLKQAIVFSSIADAIDPPDYLYSIEVASLSNLLLKQVQHTQMLESSRNVTTPEAETVSASSASARIQSELLGYLVRELRPPLTNMKTALRLLESVQLKKDQRQRYLELLHRECDRQNSLITGLLELFQIFNSAEPTSKESTKVEEIVPGIVSIYQPLASEKGIQLDHAIQSNFPPVACPSSCLKQVLCILLNNSLKFTPSNGRVFLKASWQNENVALVVSDTGCGIEASELSRVFDPFFRGRAATNDEIIGAGLGLTIAKQIIGRCGGSISVTSKIGKGSAFRVLLRVAIDGKAHSEAID